MPDREPASRALQRLMELSPEMRGGAILESGKVLAASEDEDGWAEVTADLFSAADGGGEPAEQIHVATEAGEVFALRDAKLTAVAVTERFVLASLMAFDMRTTLRELAAETAAVEGG
jgi:hypothetical protein